MAQHAWLQDDLEVKILSPDRDLGGVSTWLLALKAQSLSVGVKALPLFLINLRKLSSFQL